MQTSDRVSMDENSTEGSSDRETVQLMVHCESWRTADVIDIDALHVKFPALNRDTFEVQVFSDFQARPYALIVCCKVAEGATTSSNKIRGGHNLRSANIFTVEKSRLRGQ